MNRIAASALTACCALALAACGGPESAVPAVPRVPGAQAPQAPGADPAGSTADVCGYLREQTAYLKGIGSETGAMAQLAIGLFTFYEKQGAVPDGTQIDEQTARECPDVAAEVLKAAGITSFSAL